MLEVSPRATASEITRAYHRLAARYHPDKHQGNVLEDLAREKLIALNQAHDVLSSPERRAAYDAARAGASPRVAGTRSAAPTNGEGAKTVVGSVRGLAFLVLVLVAMPFILRLVKSPRVLLVIAVVIAAAWFGPRIVRYFRR